MEARAEVADETRHVVGNLARLTQEEARPVPECCGRSALAQQAVAA